MRKLRKGFSKEKVLGEILFVDLLMAGLGQKTPSTESGSMKNPAFFSPVQTVKRKRLNELERKAILSAQKNKCFYCGLAFGDFFVHGEKLIKVSLVWDHSLPFVFFYNNEPSNFVAACHECNTIKYHKVITDLDERIKFVREKRAAKKMPMADLKIVLQTKKEMAEVLYHEMQERFLMAHESGKFDVEKLSDWELAIYRKGLQMDKRRLV